MITRRTVPSEELERRRRQRLLGVQPLLYTRAQTARVLAVSEATVQRLEKKRLLDPVKLDRESPTGKTHYRCEQVHALASGEVGR